MTTGETMPNPPPRPAPRAPRGPRLADQFRELLPGAGDPPPPKAPAETLAELTGEIADLAVKIAALDAARDQQARDHTHPIAATISRHVLAAILILVCGAVVALYLWLALGAPYLGGTG